MVLNITHNDAFDMVSCETKFATLRKEVGLGTTLDFYSKEHGSPLLDITKLMPH